MSTTRSSSRSGSKRDSTIDGGLIISNTPGHADIPTGATLVLHADQEAAGCCGDINTSELSDNTQKQLIISSSRDNSGATERAAWAIGLETNGPYTSDDLLFALLQEGGGWHSAGQLRDNASSGTITVAAGIARDNSQRVVEGASPPPPPLGSQLVKPGQNSTTLLN